MGQPEWSRSQDVYNSTSEIRSNPRYAPYLGRERGGDRDRATGICAAQPAGRSRVHDACPSRDGRQRKTAGQTLRRHDDVRVDAVMLHREELPGAAEAALNLVGDQQDAVLVANLAQPAHELRRGDIETALALHRLDHDGRDALRVDVSLEQRVERTQGILDAHAMQVDREWRVIDLRRKGPEAC